MCCCTYPAQPQSPCWQYQQSMPLQSSETVCTNDNDRGHAPRLTRVVTYGSPLARREKELSSGKDVRMNVLRLRNVSPLRACVGPSPEYITLSHESTRAKVASDQEGDCRGCFGQLHAHNHIACSSCEIKIGVLASTKIQSDLQPK